MPTDDGKSGRTADGAPSDLLREANEKLVLAGLRTQALLESAEGFRLLVESVEDYAIFMLDNEGRIASWNAGAARIYGYLESEIRGRPFSTLYLRESIEAGQSERDVAAAKETGRFETEGDRLRKDGTSFSATVIIAALHDEVGGTADTRPRRAT